MVESSFIRLESTVELQKVEKFNKKNYFDNTWIYTTNSR